MTLILGLLGGAGRLLRAIPWQVHAALALALAGWGAWTYHKHAVATAYTVGNTAGIVEESARWSGVQAQAQVKALNNVVIAMKAQEATAQKASQSYEKALSDIDARARALGVQHGAWAARQHPAGGADLPTPGASAGGPSQAPTGDGLPWSVAYPLMTQAQKDLAQLNAILDVENAQQEAPVAGTPAK